MRDALMDELKSAMKRGDKRRVETIRLINAALKDRDIEARGRGASFGDAEIPALLQKMIKSRRESIDIFRKAGRDELARHEEEEVEIIEGFLPRQMDDAEIAEAVESALASSGATSIKDMGKVVASLKAKYSGRLDFAKAGTMIKTRLSNGQG